MEKISHKIVEYDTTYNDKLRPLTNTPIITVEISPTGSGKSHFYKNSPNTIMLMPTNSMVMQNNGLISKEQAEKYNTDNQKYRTNWAELNFNKCEYMTYDKFYGHLLSKHPISHFNIIIDEAHLLFASDIKRYQELVQILLDRKYEYKELKLISATLRVESLVLFQDIDFNVMCYHKKSFAPHIFFTQQFPILNPEQRTLVFINSIDKIHALEKYCNDKYPTIKIAVFKVGIVFPTYEDIEECQLILSTSVIKQGYSIKNKIDKIIIHNVYNAEGAIGILQYMARPRNQSPEVFVVMASTHFNKDKRPEQRNELQIDKDILKGIQKRNATNNIPKDTLNITALLIKAWAVKCRQSKEFDNPVLSNYLYENEMKNIELYYTDAKAMELIIKEFIPNATINVINKLKEYENIKFGRIDISDYTTKLEVLESIEDVKNKIKEQIIDINQSNEIDEPTKKRIISKLEKLAKIEPIESFEMDDKIHHLKNSIIVLQMINEGIYKRCKWHQFNLDNGVYQLRKAHTKSTRRLKIGDKIPLSKMKNKFKVLINLLKVKKEIDSLNLMERLYSFDIYDTNNLLITAKTSKFTKDIIITSEYPVMEEWYI